MSPQVELTPGEASYIKFQNGHCRSEIAAEVRELVGIINEETESQVVYDAFQRARQILIIGPGSEAPELDLLSVTYDRGDSTVVMDIPDQTNITLVEKSEGFEGIPFVMYGIMERFPNITVHQGVTIREFCDINQFPMFDLILYLRVEVLQGGSKPEFLGGYLTQLLNESGVAIVTGDRDGIDRLINSTEGLLRYESVIHDLPEGLYHDNFIGGHSGVVLFKP